MKSRRVFLAALCTIEFTDISPSGDWSGRKEYANGAENWPCESAWVEDCEEFQEALRNLNFGRVPLERWHGRALLNNPLLAQFEKDSVNAWRLSTQLSLSVCGGAAQSFNHSKLSTSAAAVGHCSDAEVTSATLDRSYRRTRFSAKPELPREAGL